LSQVAPPFYVYEEIMPATARQMDLPAEAAASRYFFHCFIKGCVTPDGWREDDIVGCLEVKRWEIFKDHIAVDSPDDPRWFRFRYALAPGNRLYILENHGQSQEPNGDIIWRCEDGALGDEEARRVESARRRE
jgi:hypothetical protein